MHFNYDSVPDIKNFMSSNAQYYILILCKYAYNLIHYVP